MFMENSVETRREEMIRQLFPDGIPELWCPLLTQYQADGSIDAERMRAHVGEISPWVKNFLVPGSTGDGWDMSQEEVYQVLDVMLNVAAESEAQILVGILKTAKGEARQSVEDILSRIKKRTGKEDALEALKAARVCGFTVCPPKGKDLPQTEIETELNSILQVGVPTALYQLPQITENEIAPETLYRLTRSFSNLYLFKDTSGEDKAALSGYDYRNVFFVRGAEGDYERWLRINNGHYDGFLLSTANCFAQELCQIIGDIHGREIGHAKELSARLSGAVDEIFASVSVLTDGNAFTNANKAIDHVRAFGPEQAVKRAGPKLHSGATIPQPIIQNTVRILGKYNLLNQKGYMESLRQ